MAGPLIGPEKEEERIFMRTYYGILAGLAIAATATMPAFAQAKTTEGQDNRANVRTANARLASVTTVAQTAQPGLSASTKQVEDYFNGITSLQAAFTQTVTGEATPSEGTFSWKRPGRFLWQYDTPVKQQIISTGAAVYYIDQERNQTTQLPVNAGVARLFNAKTLNLSQQGLRATSVNSTPRELSVTFAVDKKIATGDNTGLSQLTLIFDKIEGGRLMLKTIDALDTLSVTTRVEFENVRENIELSNKMFNYTPGVYEQRN